MSSYAIDTHCHWHCHCQPGASAVVHDQWTGHGRGLYQGRLRVTSSGTSMASQLPLALPLALALALAVRCPGTVGSGLAAASDKESFESPAVALAMTRFMASRLTVAFHDVLCSSGSGSGGFKIFNFAKITNAGPAVHGLPAFSAAGLQLWQSLS